MVYSEYYCFVIEFHFCWRNISNENPLFPIIQKLNFSNCGFYIIVYQDLMNRLNYQVISSIDIDVVKLSYVRVQYAHKYLVLNVNLQVTYIYYYIIYIEIILRYRNKM